MQFVGYDIINTKENKNYMKLFFLEERIEDLNHKGYSVSSEFCALDTSLLSHVGEEVECIYSKNYKGQAVLQAVKPLGKE